MIKLSFWLFLCSGLTLIFGILYFKNLHKEELLVERLKQTSDREIVPPSRENDEERNDFKIKKVKKVGCKYNSATFRVYIDSASILLFSFALIRKTKAFSEPFVAENQVFGLLDLRKTAYQQLRYEKFCGYLICVGVRTKKLGCLT